jgi:3D (Asp-Asp-Asp) domain-containing protein
VEPALDTPLQPHTAINIQRIREEIDYEEEVLPFDTVWRPDIEVPIDQRLVKTTGKEGVQRYRYRARYEGGVEVARLLEDDWVAVEPETKVIAYGQKITPLTLETPEGTITYWRKVRMYATSYSPGRSGTPKTAPWYGRTRLGMELSKGVVAVDPAVVNMQQKLYVPDYGSAIAGDTGGGVKGKHIDLGYSDDDYRSWHWWTDVYLLWPPPPSYAIRYVLPNWPQYPDRGR